MERFMEFNNAKSETFDSYLSWLKIRLITLDLLDSSYISQFKERSILKLNLFENSINEKSSDIYIELTNVQKELLKINIKEIEYFKSILETL